MKIALYLFLAIIITACTSDRLEKLSLNCGCVVEERFIASTEEEDTQTKKFTITESPLFDLGVSQKDFALSFAILINQDIEPTEFESIEISIIGSKKTKSFTFEIESLSKYNTDYFELVELINDFITNIYNSNYEKCLINAAIEMPEQEIEAILKKIRQVLYDGYLETGIAGFKQNENGYSITGSVLTDNNKMKLFRMRFSDAGGVLKIKSFEF